MSSGLGLSSTGAGSTSPFFRFFTLEDPALRDFPIELEFGSWG